MAENELLEMLATEADRRAPTIIDGIARLGETGDRTRSASRSSASTPTA